VPIGLVAVVDYGSWKAYFTGPLIILICSR